ncbi:pyridoxal phosphate phosphatase isoform X1 [Narcine bancroftii]|uniref:pyridoxal phosphate phosphatase isoform X1 n=1 Tax=Narcine bancroftii TaxID=1343680 RepID=UPI003831433D
MAGRCRRLSVGPWGRDLMAAVDAFLLDCDGVLWDGPRAIGGAAEVLRSLKERGKRVFLVSNNCSRSREEVAGKLEAWGLAAGPGQVYTTGRCSALYLRRAFAGPRRPKVYVLGSRALAAELRAAGLWVSGPGEEELPVSRCALDPEVGAVLVGYDERFSFVRLAKACSYLQDPRCHFVATDPDPWHPVSAVAGSKPSNLGDEDKEPRGPLTCTVRPVCQDGTCPESKEFWYMTTNASTITSAISFRTLGCISSGPGTGSLTAAVEAASGRKAKVIGKPSRFMFDCINEMEAGTPLDPARTLMIGDRLDTDILFGANCGLRTVLTLTGVSTLQQAHDNLASELPERRRMVPNFYVDSIKDFLPLLAS